jgi:hypothetical protein
LRSIGAARLLTAQAIEWLHFETWRDRYKAFLQQAHDQKHIYHPQRRVYTRLAGLERYGLILRMSRTTSQGVLQFRALPDAFGLSATGADLLYARRGVELSELSILPRRQRALQNMEHSIAIGQFYAALRAERETLQLSIE